MGEKYHILRCFTDDPDNDTSAADFVARTSRELAEQKRLAARKLAELTADSNGPASHNLVEVCYIDRSKRRIENVTKRLAAVDNANGSLENTGKSKNHSTGIIDTARLTQKVELYAANGSQLIRQCGSHFGTGTNGA